MGCDGVERGFPIRDYYGQRGNLYIQFYMRKPIHVERMPKLTL